MRNLAAALLLGPLLIGGADSVPALSPPPDPSFVSWFEKDGVDVSIARAETPWIRASTEIAAPAADVEAALTDFDRYEKMFHPMFRKLDVLERGEKSVRVHAVWPFPWPLRDRDGIFEYTTEHSAGGVTTLHWTNGARPGDPSVGVRIHGIAGSLRITPLGKDRCRLLYTYYGDLGGDFGKSRNEKAWRGQPLLYFRAIRRAVERQDGASIKKE